MKFRALATFVLLASSSCSGAEINDGASVYLLKGQALAGRERFDEEIAAFNQALELAPDSPDALKGLWKAYFGKADVAAAVRYSKQACGLGDKESCDWARWLGLHQPEAIAEVKRGSDLLAKGRGEEALARFQSAVKIDPTYADAYADAGAALSVQQRYDDAVVYLRTAVKLDPQSYNANVNLGSALYHRKNYDEAVSWLQKAIGLRSDDGAGFLLLGNAYYYRGDKTNAAIYWSKGCKLSDATSCQNVQKMDPS